MNYVPGDAVLFVSKKQNNNEVIQGVLQKINNRYATILDATGGKHVVGKNSIKSKTSGEPEPEPDSLDTATALRRMKDYVGNYFKCESVNKRKSLDNGDEVASMLRGKSLAEVYTIVSNGTEQEETELRIKYGHLNKGHQRMVLGNILRGFIKKRNKDGPKNIPDSTG